MTLAGMRRNVAGIPLGVLFGRTRWYPPASIGAFGHAPLTNLGDWWAGFGRREGSAWVVGFFVAVGLEPAWIDGVPLNPQAHHPVCEAERFCGEVLVAAA